MKFIKKLFSKPQIRKVDTFVSFYYNILDEPESYSPKLMKSVWKLTEEDKSNLRRLFAIYENCIQLHAEYFFTNRKAVENMKADTVFLWKTYFEIMMLYWSLTVRVFSNRSVKEEVRQTAWHFIHLMFYGMQYELFRSGSFRSYDQAFDFKHSFYERFSNRLYSSNNDVFKFSDLNYVIMKDPLSGKIDDDDLMRLHFHQDFHNSMAEAAPFLEYFTVSFNYFNKEIEKIKF